MQERGLIGKFILFLLLLITVLYFFYSAAPARAGTATPSDVQYKEDYNGDGEVNVVDVIALLLLAREDQNDPKADYNGDGSYDISDAVAMLINIMTGNLTEVSSGQDPMGESAKVIFLHHSTGNNIWKGGVSQWFTDYNSANGTSHQISERSYPSGSPYPWNNYPYDYWNIWVNHAGSSSYMGESTLEILTPQYDVIIFKHCYPVSGILQDTGSPSVSSKTKSIENYKLQYEAVKLKMLEFPDNRFIVWTGAALVQANTSEASGKRAKEFFEWVRDEWDDQGDNIYVWDFFELETEGGYYLKNEYAASSTNSHPNTTFAHTVAPYFSQRIIDIIDGRGDISSVTGKEAD